jgi:hypothetical protein
VSARIHDRHFTRAEADALVPKLETLMSELRRAKESLTDAEAHRALSEASGGNGGGSEGRKVGEAFLLVRGMLAELHQAGIVVRDIDRGLLDFPAVLDEREVYLCWRVGEDSVGFWHDLDSGFQARQPLE